MSFRPPDWLRFEFYRKWERMQYRWQELAIRKWVNRNPKAVITITAASGLVLLSVAILQLLPEKTITIEPIEKEWYYDLNTGQLFTAKKGLTPPIEAPSGPLPNGQLAGVRAYVLAYSNNASESERFIAFLEKADLTAQHGDNVNTNNAHISGAKKWGKGKLIRRIDDELWSPADSSLGLAILEEAFLPNEDGERPLYCHPK
jgi:hypothetical protein